MTDIVEELSNACGIEVVSQQRNIQIAVETMTRCAGNCSGCALSSVERMDTTFDYDNFYHKTLLVRKQLLSLNVQEVESLTIFLGQGDHFLMDYETIPHFMKSCSEMIPEALKNKTVVFITASAIGKSEHILKKTDLFYDYSLLYRLPFFIQVVFDPKKMQITDKFKEIYINNILYFKQKCGMTEVTVNMGEDLFNYMSPQSFHDWIKEYGFKHIEMNWVTNQFTHSMWKKSYQDMLVWLENWLAIYRQDPVYEINFLPFLARHFLKKDVKLMNMHVSIQEAFRDNYYIDYEGNLLPSQMGLISNLTPFGQRNSLNNKNVGKTPEEMSRKVISSLLRKESCNSCEYASICSLSGVVPLFEYDVEQNLSDCPWEVKRLLRYIETNFIHLSHDGRKLTDTIFDKNPVQNDLLVDNDNATYRYFENAIEDTKHFVEANVTENKVTENNLIISNYQSNNKKDSLHNNIVKHDKDKSGYPVIFIKQSY